MSKDSAPALASLEQTNELFDVKVDVAGGTEWDGAESNQVAYLNFRSDGEGGAVRFDVTLQEDRALEVAEQLVAAVVHGQRTPDERSIDDITAADECAQCSMAPAAIILTGGTWECYNCGTPAEGDPDA